MKIGDRNENKNIANYVERKRFCAENRHWCCKNGRVYFLEVGRIVDGC